MMLSAITVDGNADGYLDAIRITLSEPGADASLPGAVFTAAGASVTGTGATPDDAMIDVLIVDGVLAGDDQPAVSYSGGSLADLVGNLLLPAGPLVPVDGASPVLWSATGGEGSLPQAGIDADDSVTMVFNEDTTQPATIDTILALSGGHSWLDGSGAIGSAVWTDARTLLVTLSTASSLPTITVGDTITLDGVTIQDLAANPGIGLQASAIGGTFTPPILTSVATADADADGYVDRLVVTFSTAVDETTAVASRFTVSTPGTVVSVVDDGTPADAVIWVKLADDRLSTGDTPSLSLDAAAILDSFGTPSLPVSGVVAADSAPPVSLLTLAAAGRHAVYVRFSEEVAASDGSLSPNDFSYSDGGNPITIVLPTDPAAARTAEIFLSLQSPLAGADVLLPRTVVVVAAAVQDAVGNLAPVLPHRVSDMALGLVTPLWARTETGNTDGGGPGTPVIRGFDGTGALELGALTLQLSAQAGTTVSLSFSQDVPAATRVGSIWLPQRLPGLAETGHSGAKQVVPFAAQAELRSFLIPKSDLSGSEKPLEFVVEIDGLFAARLINPVDPRTVVPWSLQIQEIRRQRGNVTILSNVIDPAKAQRARVLYTLDRAGDVLVVVSDLNNNVIRALDEGPRARGEYAVEWDGRNAGGRLVAPGLYLVRVVR